MTIKEYWNLIGREPFLAITWEPDFFQASSFLAVLVHVNEPYKLSIYKNSRQNQWSDFVKKSKNHVFGPFLTIFRHLCPMGFFSKKSGCHTQLYMGPKYQIKFQRKLMSQSRKKFMGGRTEGRTEGWKDE